MKIRVHPWLIFFRYLVGTQRGISGEIHYEAVFTNINTDQRRPPTKSNDVRYYDSAERMSSAVGGLIGFLFSHGIGPTVHFYRLQMRLIAFVVALAASQFVKSIQLTVDN